MPAWAKAEDGVFHAIGEDPDGTRYNLTVERRQGDGHGWEWRLWRAGQPKALACRGFSGTLLDAMAQAERMLCVIRSSQSRSGAADSMLATTRKLARGRHGLGDGKRRAQQRSS